MAETIVLYLHGKGGSAAESAHYMPLFPNCEVVGLDYKTFAPWETGTEVYAAASALKQRCERLVLIANSIGAYFGLCAGIDALLERAYFISPIVDMERLILDMMAGAGVTETELEAKREIPTAFGETLSWNYLRWVRQHPVRWNVPTEILYGGSDNLTSRDTVEAFAMAHNARLTVMESGEHWFHTEEQMRFLDAWLTEREKG